MSWNGDMSRVSDQKCEPFIRDDPTEQPKPVGPCLTAEEKQLKKEQHLLLRSERKKDHLKRKKEESKLTREKVKKLDPDPNRLSKRDLIELQRKKLQTLSRETHLSVSFDFGWSESLSQKDQKKLASQIGRIHGANKKDQKSANIYFTNFSERERFEVNSNTNQPKLIAFNVSLHLQLSQI